VDAEGAHEVRVLEEDLVVHDVVETGLHDLFFVGRHLDAEKAAHGGQVAQQGDDVLDAGLADDVGLADGFGDLAEGVVLAVDEAEHLADEVLVRDEGLLGPADDCVGEELREDV